MTDEEIKAIDAKGRRGMDSIQFEAQIKEAIASATAGNIAAVVRGDDELRRDLEARAVLALVWPLVKDRVGTRN